jgi:hypothetical protein
MIKPKRFLCDNETPLRRVQPANGVTQMSDEINLIVKDAADMIARYNPRLARLFINQPFNRVTIAHAFAAGFNKSKTADVHYVANIVLRIAYTDREHRSISAA